MARVLLQYLLPLLLPFAIYIAFLFLTKGRQPGWLNDLPWITLSSIGVALLAVSLVTWTMTTGASPDKVYVPPAFVDGEIVPGHTVER